MTKDTTPSATWDAMSDQQKIEWLAVFAGWYERLTPSRGWTYFCNMHCINTKTGKPYETCIPAKQLKNVWNPLTNWNHTMEVWQGLIDRKLAPRIDETDDHATVLVGRLDALSCLEIFVHVEHTNAREAICKASFLVLNAK